MSDAPTHPWAAPDRDKPDNLWCPICRVQKTEATKDTICPGGKVTTRAKPVLLADSLGDVWPRLQQIREDERKAANAAAAEAAAQISYSMDFTLAVADAVAFGSWLNRSLFSQLKR